MRLIGSGRRASASVVCWQTRDNRQPGCCHHAQPRASKWPMALLISGGRLGCVRKLEPVSGGREMDHSEEAVGQLIVSGGDGAVDLELPVHALDAIALLVERPIMFAFHAAV